MRKSIVIMLMAALYGCSEMDIGRARDVVKSQLYDGDSALFRDERVYHSDGHTVICGEVNTKSSIGGYSGFQPFIVTGGLLADIGDHARVGCEFAEIGLRLKT